MKRIYNYTFQLVCIYLLVLFIFTFFNIEINSYNTNVSNENLDKTIDSNKLVDFYKIRVKIEKEKKQQEKVKEEKTDEIESKQPIEPIKEEVTEKVNMIDTSNYMVLATETVNLSHYGHDCYGCTSGYTASGYYIGDGNIYYQDNTFGSVRVVAADNKYPLGSILRINYNGSVITAIVLDRGGGIGDGKKFQIDLLTHSNSEAYQLGIVQNTQLEVLRLGY